MLPYCSVPSPTAWIVWIAWAGLTLVSLQYVETGDGAILQANLLDIKTLSIVISHQLLFE